MSATLLNSTYQEAMRLIVEVRDYIATNQALIAGEPDPARRFAWTQESLLMTTRLAQVMAWALVRRAVHAGEMTAEEASAEPHRLGARELCLAQDDGQLEPLPPYMRSLAERSRALYARVARLDDLLGAA
jgi:regulator of CtrA degradation